MDKYILKEGQYGIKGYQCPKKYFQTAQTYHSVNPLKRGHYLQQLKKITKQVPGVGCYNLSLDWGKPRKINSKAANRKTYIDDVMILAKRHKMPGPCQYFPGKTLKEQYKIQKQLRKASSNNPISQKRNYLYQLEKRAQKVPGPGSYSSVVSRKNFAVVSKATPKDWKDKHKKQQKQKAKRIKSASPISAKYNPFDCNLGLFEYTNNSKKEIDKIQRPSSAFGTESRFKQSKKKNNKKQEDKLGPGFYDITCNWKGKSTGKNKNYFEKLSHGTFKPLY